MIISSLKLKDFGIFYGSQSLSLRDGLYVIHGLNGRGKTTLLNAVRWTLYGRYADRQGRPVPADLTLNRQARREGQTEFSVELVLVDGGEEYVIRRRQFVSAAGPAQSQLYIERNSQPLTAAERERAIKQLLDEQVSQFFLFDGEQLQRYEVLLSHEETASGLIKQSIEQILGLPMLEHASDDLWEIRQDLNKRLARLARQNQQLEQLGARAEQAQADLDSKRADIGLLRAQQDVQHRIILEQDGFLQKYENSLDQLKNLEALDGRVAVLREQRQSLSAHRADSLREAWRDVLAVTLEPQVKELKRLAKRQERSEVLRITRSQLENTLETSECALCGLPLGAEASQHITDELAKIRLAEAHLELTDPEDIARLPLLTSLVNTGQAETAIRMDKEIAGIDSNELALRQEAARLRDALENLPKSEVTSAQKARDQAYQEVGRLRAALESAQAEQAEIEDRLRRAQDDIRKAGSEGGQQAELIRAIDLANDLRNVFSVAKERFRDELRTAVEASATDVFKQLTNEPEFIRLAINGSYGLEIIDSRGEVVAGRSAGQEQVVALSLMASLNKNARRGAPVIMDTPFGRLDPVHRTNILRFLPRLADQVFLFVHGGELTDDDLSVIAADIQAQFDLQRDDTDRTTIIPRRAR